MAALRILIAEREEQLVRKARRTGLGWYEIAWWLGVSRQAVSRKWSLKLLLEELEDLP